MSWGVSENASDIEKLKSEMADYLHGLNSCAEINYSVYSELFDFSLPLIQKAYDLGKMELDLMSCPYCGSNKIGTDRDYARHIGPKDEWETIGSEMYCLNCGKYVFPANKWLVDKNAKSIDN